MLYMSSWKTNFILLSFLLITNTFIICDINITSSDGVLNLYVNGSIISPSPISIAAFTVQNIAITLYPNDYIEIGIDLTNNPSVTSPAAFIAEVIYQDEQGNNVSILTDDNWYCGFSPSSVQGIGNSGNPNFGGAAISGISSSANWIWDYAYSQSLVCSYLIRPRQVLTIYMQVADYFDAYEIKDSSFNSLYRKDLNDIARTDFAQANRCRSENAIIFIENGYYLYLELGNCSTCSSYYGFQARLTIEQRNQPIKSIDLKVSDFLCSDNYRSSFRTPYLNQNPVYVAATTGSFAAEVCSAAPFSISGSEIIWSNPNVETVICQYQFNFSDACP